MTDRFIVSAGFAIVLLCAAAVVAFWKDAASAPRRKPLPISEYGVLTGMRFAAWLMDLMTAWDAAIVRYRHERQTTEISLVSTRTREGVY